MIKKVDCIMSQKIPEVEKIFTKFITQIVEKEQEKKLNINNVEKIIGETITLLVNNLMSTTGELLSNVEGQDNCSCEKCKKKFRK